MTYHIAICDDSASDIEYVGSAVQKWAEQSDNIIKIDRFSSAEEFLCHYEDDKSYDILLLDIEMKALSGVELAKAVRKDNESVQIIFITGYSDYIAEGYEVSALHYLMKPLDTDKLYHVLNKAAEKIRKNEKLITLETSDETIRIPIGEIRFIDVFQNYVTVHAKSEYTVRRTLSEIEAELDDHFFRTGRSCIINLQFIRRVTKKEVYLSDGTAVPIPRGAYAGLNRAIIDRM